MEERTAAVPKLVNSVLPQQEAGGSTNRSVISPVVSPGCKCAICLGSISKSASPNSCRHQFCFDCLAEWAKIKTECPLCKGTFISIIYFSANGKRLQHFVHGSPPSAFGSFEPANRTTGYRFRVNLMEEFVRYARQQGYGLTTPPPLEASNHPVAQSVGAAGHDDDGSSDDDNVPTSNIGDLQDALPPRDGRDLASFRPTSTLTSPQSCPATPVIDRRQTDFTGSHSQKVQKHGGTSIFSTNRLAQPYLNCQEQSQSKKKAPGDMQVRPAAAAAASTSAQASAAAAVGHFTETTGAPAITVPATFSNSATSDDDSTLSSDSDLPIVTDVFAYMESLRERRARRRAERDLARSAAGPSNSTGLHTIRQADIATIQTQPKQERVEMFLASVSQHHQSVQVFQELTQPQQEVPDVIHSRPAGAHGGAAGANSAVTAATAATAAASNAVPSEADADSSSDVIIVSEQKPWGERTPVVLSSDSEDDYDRAVGRSRSRSRSPLRAAADATGAGNSHAVGAQKSGGSGQGSQFASAAPSNPDQTGSALRGKSRRNRCTTTRDTVNRTSRTSTKCQIGVTSSTALATAGAKHHSRARLNKGSPEARKSATEVVGSGDGNSFCQVEEPGRGSVNGRRLRSRSPLCRVAHGDCSVSATSSSTSASSSNNALMIVSPAPSSDAAAAAPSHRRATLRRRRMSTAK